MAKQTKPTPGPQEGLPSPQQAALAGGDTGWRKTAVVLAGILALCYAVHPSIAAVSASEFYYGVLLLSGGYAGLNVMQHRWFASARPGQK
ncbi:MAG: hypothetical protein O7B80_05965 [bacterium]|nr:hypothetical protein [bacterium]